MNEAKNKLLEIRGFGYLAFLILISLFLNSCFKNCTTVDNDDYMPIYNYEEIKKNGMVEYVEIIDTILLVKHDYPIRKKAELLAQFISGRYFAGLSVDILSIDTIGEESCLNINLIENKNFDPAKIPSWHQYFQGTTGGSWTSNVLISNFLQKQYKGDWIDRIRFYYQGEEIGEWDHVWVGEHERYDFEGSRLISQ